LSDRLVVRAGHLEISDDDGFRLVAHRDVHVDLLRPFRGDGPRGSLYLHDVSIRDRDGASEAVEGFKWPERNFTNGRAVTITADTIIRVWEKGSVVIGVDPDVWRKDACTAW